jgi:uncharacterized protein (TIGR02145 family)
MKKLITLSAAILITTIVFAQAPNKMSYQAVIRNSSNTLINNQAVGMKISILQNSPTGNAVYVETQTPTTNTNGLASIEIGGGTVVFGNFSSINWANGPFFCKTETDPTGGTTYTITATSQLLSVPYALFSGNGIIGVTATGDSLLLGNGTSIIIPGISEANNNGGQTGIDSHTCGATNVHNPLQTYGTLTDQDGNVYKTIVIGNQEWMAENLKTRIYRNGESISNITNNIQWSNLTTGAWCHYNNDSLYECPYGKLYNWYAVVDNRNLCPTNWHVPSVDDWNQLSDFLGGDPVAGSKLKSTGNSYWYSPNEGATNESGFSALPGGIKYNDGQNLSVGGIGWWWSSTEQSADAGFQRSLQHFDTIFYNASDNKRMGYSVRCVKD